MENLNLKSEGYYNVINELIANNRNLHSIFQVKLVQSLELQMNLGLNKIIDANSKKIIFEYLRKEETKAQFLQQIKIDPIISQFQQCLLKQKQKDYMNLDGKYDEMLQKMKQKSKNDDESLTLKKQYELMLQDVKRCFITNTSFADNKNISSGMRQKIESWRLNLPQYTFDSNFICSSLNCKRKFVNKSGLSMHEKTCVSILLSKLVKNQKSTNRNSNKANVNKKGRKLRKANTRQTSWAN